MRIEHISLWTEDLERSRQFYEKYFQGKSSARYHNTRKDFQSYFISFDDESRLEIMKMPGIHTKDKDRLKEFLGLAHFAMSVGSKEQVDFLADQLRDDG